MPTWGGALYDEAMVLPRFSKHAASVGAPAETRAVR